VKWGQVHFSSAGLGWTFAIACGNISRQRTIAARSNSTDPARGIPMQILVQVVCTRGPSLRDAISKATRLDRHLLRVSEQKRSGRKRGWTKVHSTEPDRRGAINLEWDANTSLLLARVITRGQGKASLIIGDFVHLLMSRYRRRIQAINIIPRG
jgi:hypothetical protein